MPRSFGAAKRPTVPLELNLTFGVEIEFLLLVSHYPQLAHKYTDYGDLGERQVHEALSGPMPGVCTACRGMFLFHIPLAPLNGALTDTQWVVGTDGTVRLQQDDFDNLEHNVVYYNQFAIELRSRVLDDALKIRAPCDCGMENVVDHNDEIHAVLTRLKLAFNTAEGATGERRDTRIVYNQTCGLHVHVGNRGYGFPLRTIKTVLAATIANERVTDVLHATDRVSGTTYAMGLSYPDCQLDIPGGAYNSPWSKNMSRSAYTLRDWEAYPGDGRAAVRYFRRDESIYPENEIMDDRSRRVAGSYDMQDWLTLIVQAPDLNALKQLHWGTGHNCVLNLDNVQEYNSDGHNHTKITLEFRQHASTLESIQVLSWIDYIRCLVLFCHRSSNRILLRHTLLWCQPDHSALDLLYHIKCKPCTIYHYSHKLGFLRENEEYARDLNLREHQDVDEFMRWDMTKHLRRNLIDERWHANAFMNVLATRAEKFAHGGYGQFSAEFLAAYVDWTGCEYLRDLLTAQPYVPPEFRGTTPVQYADLTVLDVTNNRHECGDSGAVRSADPVVLRVMNPDRDDASFHDDATSHTFGRSPFTDSAEAETFFDFDAAAASPDDARLAGRATPQAGTIYRDPMVSNNRPEASENGDAPMDLSESP